jgi:hypothetical protein
MGQWIEDQLDRSRDRTNDQRHTKSGGSFTSPEHEERIQVKPRFVQS